MKLKQPLRTPTLEDLAQYCQTAGRACFGCHSPEVLRDYLVFHLQQGTLRWLRGPDDQIAGVATAIGMPAALIRARAAHDQSVFQWEPHQPGADALYIMDVVGTLPPALPNLILALARQFPDCARQEWLTFRHGRLVTLSPRVIQRIFKRNRKETFYEQ
jgi:hypothetical protein